MAEDCSKKYGLSRPRLKVIISLDVEEEGLFSGAYQAKNCQVRNVQLLRRLAPISRELGFPLTLFCAHSVFENKHPLKTLAWMREQCGAEIGAHLHHWSTPPFAPEQAQGTPERTDKMPRGLLRQRLESLLQAGRKFLGQDLTSFRMGRWDLKSEIRPMLSEMGILVDSSVCPLRYFANGPDHFLAPCEPYWVPGFAAKPLLELPITQIPLHPDLPLLWERYASKGIRDSFHFFAALSANPLWHSQRVMRLATRLHHARGGKVLNFFWHSSEMLPGGSPKIPNRLAAEKLFAKIFSFCRWLRDNFAIEALTATEIRNLALEPQIPWHKAIFAAQESSAPSPNCQSFQPESAKITPAGHW